MSKVLIVVLGIVVGVWASTSVSGEPHEASSSAANELRVVMYSTKTCGYCAQARAYFQQHGVRWEERDVEASKEARAEWKALGGFATPLILINDHRLVGFSRDDLDEELEPYGK